VRASLSRLRAVLETRPSSRVFVVGCLLLVVGCGRSSQQPTTNNKQPARVITLAPNLTEILFAIGAGDRIVATDDFSDSPPAAKRLPKVGGMEPNIERIVAAKPDLVLASSSANVTALRSAHLPLEVIKTDRLEDVERVMTTLGAELHAPHAADAARAVREGLAKQRRTRAHPPRILFAAWNQPLYVGGRETFIDDLLQLCGAQNAVQVTGWPQYAVESVVAAPPDIVLHSSRLDMEPLLRAAPELRTRSRVIAIDENRFTRPGPHVVDAARNLNAIIDAWEKSRR
jgi:ABC-type hemin transport system substrate-binding protein